jgi:hypothetical protein
MSISENKKKDKADSIPRVSANIPRQVVEIIDEGLTPQKEKESSSAELHPVQPKKEKKFPIDSEDITVPTIDISTPDKEIEKETLHASTIPITDTSSPIERQKEVVKELFRKKETVLDEGLSVHEKKSNISFILWIVIILTVAFLVSGGLILMFGDGLPNISISQKIEPSPTTIPTITPSPTGTAEQKKDVKIQVLNGNGEKGVAGTMKTILEGKGYTVSDTGNAGTYDYENTEITVKSGKENIADQLRLDLLDEYAVIISDKTLDNTSSYDVQVIVGKK